MLVGEIAVQAGIALASSASIATLAVVLKKKFKKSKKKEITMDKMRNNNELFTSFK